MITADLPKSYTPADHESDVRAKWEQSNGFHTEPDPARKPYSIVIPPPNVTAALHLGHALNNALQDVLIRYHRMAGFNTLWMPGTDHAGIATQTVVDKRLQTEGKPSLRDYKKLEAEGQDGREQFIAQIQSWKDEYEATISEQLKMMGCSCDFDRQRFTMDEMCAKAVREAFFRLFKDGLIYRGKRLVNWDPVSQTALADDEVEMEEVHGHMHYLRYPLVPLEPSPSGRGQGEGNEEYIVVATTRPETMLGDTAVAINPKDPRAEKYVGRTVKLPIVGREIPIIADDYVVRPAEFGGDPNDAKAKIATGFLKVTPAHDPNDYDIGQRHNLEMVNIFAPDATISDQHGWTDISDEARKFIGLSREEGRKQVIAWFKEHDLLERIVDYTHSVGHSYRSHVPIEPYLSDQWYVKVTDDRLRGSALRAMNPEQVSSTGVPPVNESSGTGVPPVSMPEASKAESIESQKRHAPSPITDELTISRRNLPHWQVGGSTYFITFTLREGAFSDHEKQIVLSACQHFHGDRLHLHLATVMPDHVHMLMTPREKSSGEWWSLSELLHSIKSFSAHEILKSRGATGSLWQDESFDRIVRDDDEFLEKWNYIAENPVRAGLADRAEAYAWTARPSTAESAVEASPAVTGETPVPPAAKVDGELTFHPARYAKTFQQWHENIRDWCISRQIWWGHRIPVWTISFLNRSPGNVDPARQYVYIKSQVQELHVLLHDFANLCGIQNEIAFSYMGSSYFFACSRTEKSDAALTWLSEYVEWHQLDSNRLRKPKPLPPEFAKRVVASTSKPVLIDRLCEHLWKCEQDPDVLDTWFSSGLWPLSTMGWPDPSAYPETQGLLEQFNPTSVLCTAREIITLWVSRMVMFNRYFQNGTLPFDDVFIHAMIQDGHGQKMSKSLGNGVDPRDIIHSHGADAMRYALVQMTTQTQDVRMPVDLVCPHCEHAFTPKEIKTSGGATVAAPEQTCPKCSKSMVSAFGVATGQVKATNDKPVARNTSPRFDLGRNFCNKLWNATRFALNNLNQSTQAHGQQSVGLEDLSTVDKWMLARLHRALHTVEDAIKDYQFSVYANTMYDLIWGDFCDWYLEAIKPTIKTNAAQQQVLRTVLNAIVRLLHPIMPFVTEALWPHVQAAGPAGLPGAKLPPNDILAIADWPDIACSIDDKRAHDEFARAQQLVIAIRNVRGEHKVPPKKKITLLAGKAVRALIDRTGPVVPALAELEAVESIPADRPKNAVTLLIDGEEQLLTGILAEANTAAEIDRLKKELADLEKKRKALEGRLANPGYTQKAPPELVQETKDELAKTVAEIAAKADMLNGP